MDIGNAEFHRAETPMSSRPLVLSESIAGFHPRRHTKNRRGTTKGIRVKFKNVTVAAIVVGGLMAGVGATPAMATAVEPTAAFTVSNRASAHDASIDSSARMLTRQLSNAGAVPFAPGAAALPPESSPKFLPVLLALGRAFVAAVKVVPPAFAKLAPAVRSGASAVGKFVKNNAPGAAKAIVSGLSTSALWEILKNIFGF